MTQIILSAGGFGSITVSTNAFYAVGNSPIPNASSPTQAQAQITWRNAGTFSGLTLNDQSGPGISAVLTYQVGGSNGNQTITVDGSVTEYFDTTHTDSVSAGNQVNYKYANSTGNSGNPVVIAMKFSPSTTANTINKMVSLGGITDTSVNTSYYNILGGDLDANTTEANAQFKILNSATLQNMYVYISANTVSIASAKSRIGGADGNLVCSISSGTTGIIEDTTHSDSLSSGNLVNTVFVSTVTTTITVNNIAVDLLTTNSVTHYMTGDANPGGNQTQVSSGSTFVTTLAGDFNGLNTGDTTASFQTGLSFTLSNLEALVQANTGTSTTIRLRKNAANGNEILSYGSAATGYLQDSTHTDSITSTNEINYNIVVGGASKTTTFSNIGIMASYPVSITIDANIRNEFLSKIKFDPTALEEFTASPKIDQTVRLENIGGLQSDRNALSELNSNAKVDATEIFELLPCWQMQQNTQAGFTQSASARTIQFTKNVKTGGFLVIVVGLESSSTAPTVTVSDDQNGAWTQAGTYTTSASRSCSIFYFVNSVGGVRPIVTVTPSLSSYMGLALNEFSVSSSASSVAFDHGSNSTNSGNTASTGTCTVSGPSELVIAGASQGANIIVSPTVALPFIIGAVQPDGQVDEAAASAYDPNASVSEACTFTYNGSANALALAASFKISLTTAIIIDAVMRGEFLSSQKTDIDASLEFKGTVKSDIDAVHEFLSSLINDDTVYFEKISAGKTDGNLRLEDNASGKSDADAMLENIGNQKTDSTMRDETISGARGDATQDLEYAASHKSERNSPAEFNTSLRSDINAALELLAKNSIDANALFECTLVITFQADGILQNEWIENQKRDIGIYEEVIASYKNDSNLFAEELSSTQLDVKLGQEFSSNVSGDTRIYGEALAGFRKDFSLFAESLSSSRSDGTTGNEFYGNSSRDAIIRLESITNALNNSNLPFDTILTTSIFTVNASIQFEWRTNYVSDTHLPTEMRLNFNTPSNRIIDPKAQINTIDPQNQGRIFTLKVTKRNL